MEHLTLLSDHLSDQQETGPHCFCTAWRIYLKKGPSLKHQRFNLAASVVGGVWRPVEDGWSHQAISHSRQAHHYLKGSQHQPDCSCSPALCCYHTVCLSLQNLSEESYPQDAPMQRRCRLLLGYHSLSNHLTSALFSALENSFPPTPLWCR